MQELISNPRGERAFNRQTGRIVTLAVATALCGLTASSVSAQPKSYHRSIWAIRWEKQHPAKPQAFHRSVWAIRWDKEHPAQAASYQRSLSARRHPAARRHVVSRRGVRIYHRHSTPWSLSLRPILSTPPPSAQPATGSADQTFGSGVSPVSYAAPVTRVAYAVKPSATIKQDLETAVPPQNVTLDFVAADINDVLKALAVQTHSNIVSGNDVKGTITVSLSQVTLDEALDMISKLSGYQYAKVGRTYVVGSPASIGVLTASGTATAPPTTAVIQLNYSDPTDLINIIKDRYPSLKMTPGKASGNQGGGGGVLIITGPQGDVDSVRELIASTETALSKGIAASSTIVYKIKYAAADDLQSVLARLVPGVVVTPGPAQGFTLKAPSTADAGGATSTTASYGSTGASTGAAAAGGGSPTALEATKPTTYSLLLTGSPVDISRAEAILEEVDVKPAQITYEAKITEINLNSAKKIGLNWDFSGATTRIGELPDNVSSGKPVLGDNSNNNQLRKIFQFGYIARTAVSNLATVSLDALFQNGDAKLLSDPNISAVDGQQAAVFIGDTINYISSITQTPTGQNVTTATVNIGIKLYVTGKVSNDGYVTMNIHPEVSTISGYLNVPGGGQLPQIANREATTTVRVKDGDTLAIGGLISENDVKNVSKVPFFGDLPFFGNLFRDTSHTHNRNEIVIFVKVSIAKDKDGA